MVTDVSNRAISIHAYIPTTIVSSGISSRKHFFSVSPIWKYSAEDKSKKKAINTNDK